MTGIKWKYIWPYLLFVGTILIAITLNVLFIVSGIEQNKYYAELINRTGKQRYRSQLNISNLLQYERGTFNMKEATKNLSEWNDTHLSIQSGIIKSSFTELDNSIINSFQALNPIQEQLFALIQKAYTKGTDSSGVSMTLKHQADYFTAMDNIVFLFQRKAELTLIKTRQKQVWTAFFSGLILILEIIFLIIPYHKKLINAYAKLKENKLIIEEQASAIKNQMESISIQKLELENLHGIEKLTLAGINAGVWSWDISTGAESWSPNFYHILGYEVNEIPANYETFIHSLVHPDDKASVEDAVRLHLESNQKYQINIRMRTKTGEYKWYDASGLASRDQHGKPLRMAGSIIDITDKILYQNQLEASNQTKNKIFAILSHDLRSPLIGIKGLLDLHTDGSITKKDFEDHMYLMHDGIGFALRTLDNVLLWSSAQMNAAKITATNFLLCDIITEVELFHKYLALQKEITITYSIPSSITAYADSNHVFIITRNLVGNAIKFTHKGGRIDVSASADEKSVSIKVEDNGVGMEQEFINRLMNRQEHLSTYGTNREKGTGLGVNLILDLLQMNQGKLTIESVPNKGSKFIYTIPVGMKADIPDFTT